jgi:hypothetical protein
MARMSAEARAASMLRAGGKAPTPPAHLDASAKRLWRQITHSRPPDFFAPGASHLLEAFVETVTMHRFYMRLWEKDPTNLDHLKSIVALNNSLSQLSVKLRISNSSVYNKKSGILTEPGEPEPEGSEEVASNVMKLRSDVLFGGGGQLKY